MASSFSWYGPEVARKLDARMRRRLKLAGIAVEAEAKRSMGGQKTGKWYRKPYTKAVYQASAPGEAPAARTGGAGLQGSITTDEPFKRLFTWHCHVGTDEPYAPYLELGTSRMRPRPFLRPALDRSRSKVQTILAGATTTGGPTVTGE